MLSNRLPSVLALSLNFAATAALIPGDVRKGAELFKSQQCVACHSVAGHGARSAPDLARRQPGRYTPSLLAATLWNHAPRMWEAMEKAKIEKPRLSPEDAANLFAYFYAFRYGEQPGDAGRGKQVFDAKGCIACHGPGGAGPPVSNWPSVGDPIQLARAMWNHAPRMKAAMRPGMSWPQLTAQEMTDLTVYVQNQPRARKFERQFAPASAQTGEALFQAKGCAGCHTGNNALAGRIRGRTLAGLAAAMWNHAPRMRDSAQELRPEEMTRLVGYLWSIQYFDEPGNPARGERVAAKKGCNSCHGVAGSGAPEFKSLAGSLDAIRFVSDTWRHGPDMLNRMKSANLAWPRFERNDLNDLLAYINSL